MKYQPLCFWLLKSAVIGCHLIALTIFVIQIIIQTMEVDINL